MLRLSRSGLALHEWPPRTTERPVISSSTRLRHTPCLLMPQSKEHKKLDVFSFLTSTTPSSSLFGIPKQAEPTRPLQLPRVDRVEWIRTGPKPAFVCLMTCPTDGIRSSCYKMSLVLWPLLGWLSKITRYKCSLLCSSLSYFYFSPYHHSIPSSLKL